ncbi:MAG: zinc-binding protein [Deltaproteobacteria bacterium HGW-Deltaproteobacteria-7]|jgi:zinc transport system substrate-binding protein|nr:MAG: zinc-binding protein [Deltaproteobacteria bacterium HGW-Deltaproteobacteria-7]PKN20059.1 MAG: zinc-binding protein [Deltaproteobacteria bacterium HGW-Deltaproteobacteria-6]
MIDAKKIFLLTLIGLFLIVSCKQAEEQGGRDTRLKVMATIFPLYDFARNIGGDKVTVTMLLPPASDAHHYELKPNDIVRVSKTDIFLFTSFEMEQWAYKVINAAAEKTNMLAVETGQGAALLPLSVSQGHYADHQPVRRENDMEHATRFDPHIWLDFTNAQKMIDNITTAFINKDPANSETYKKNAEDYKRRLTELDSRYRAQLSNCKTRTILHAGHWAFAYLAQKNNLKYRSAYNMSADAEPSPQQIVELIEQVKEQKLAYIYYEDLTAPKLARTIASETGAGLLKLSNGHDISKKDIQDGESFITLMERNLVNLKKGMQCP